MAIIINNLITLSVQSYHRKISDLRLDAIDLAIAWAIHQGLGLRFPCNNLTLS